jgi:hypothetical protein
MSNCLSREAGVPMLDGVAGRGLAVRLDCKPNDNLKSAAWSVFSDTIRHGDE